MGHLSSKNENLECSKREQEAKIGHHLAMSTMTLLVITAALLVIMSVRLRESSESLVMMVQAEGECLHVLSNASL